MTEFRHAIGLEFPATVGKKDIRNFPLMQHSQSAGTGGDRIRAKHQNSVDIEGEGIIELWIDDVEVAFTKLCPTKGIAGVRWRNAEG